jgi:DNA-binding PadR family transcriptional regulator
MARYSRSNLLALAVLVCLLERPMHPYEMATVMRHRGKEESIKLNYGSLYTVVKALSKAGFIEAQETEREGRRPERTVYRLLQAGHVELIDWLSDMVSIPAKEYRGFEAALSMLPALPPEDAQQLLEERCSRLELMLLQHQTMRQMMDTKLELPEIFGLESDFAATLLQSELDWVQRLRSRIVSGDLGGLIQWRQFMADQGDRLST